jgi:type II pantothenate kinase
MQQAPPNPVALPVTVDTTGAKILEGSLAEHDSRDIYLPNHVETVSHIAIDVGGSLAKVVYFTRIARPTVTPTHSTYEAATSQSPAASSSAAIPASVAHAIPVGARSPASNAGSRMHSRESSANLVQTVGGDLTSSTESVKHEPTLNMRRSRSNLSHGSHISQTADGSYAVPAGTLTPTSLFTSSNAVSASAIHSHFMKRRSLPAQLPGGRLNFVKFETADINSCVNFLRELIDLSAKANNVSLAQMRKGVKLMATGGGAHLFNDLFEQELGIEVRKEDEMGCLITGLNFITLIPDETFYYSDELVDTLSATSPGSMTKRQDASAPCSAGSSSSSLNTMPAYQSAHAAKDTNSLPLPRPSPDPPLYSPVFDSNPLPKLPCLLVNIGSGVSVIKVDEDGSFERVSGTSLGGGTLWGLLSLVTDAESFDEMLEMASRGDNGSVDMLVSDVYGASDALSNLGLKSTTIASSFGKVFRKDKSSLTSNDDRGKAREARRKKFRQEDICKSLLYAISNNIGQIAYMNAEKFGLDRIYFGGCFIRGHQATIATLSYAIRFWSKGSKRAFFLRHEGYLGALGAWIRQFYDGTATPSSAANATATPIPRAQAAAQHALNELVGRGAGHEASSKKANGTPLSSTQSTPAAKLAKQESSSSNATPKGNASQSQAITPAMSRQQSDFDSSPVKQTKSVNAPINPLLAEALGVLDEKKPLTNGHTSDATVSHTRSQEDRESLDRADATADGQNKDDLSAMLETLTEEHRQMVEGLVDANSDELGEEADLDSIADLLKKMDMVNGAADGLEGKLDSLLARLDNIIDAAEEDQQSV